MNLVVLGAIGLLWLAALSSWKLRNLRTVAVLVTLSAVLVLLGLLPQPASAVAQGVTWIAALVGIGTLGHRWLVVDAAQVLFAESYAKELQRIAELKGRASTSEPSAYIAAFDAAVATLAGLSAPTDDWAALQDDTVRELGIRSAAMKVGIEPPPESLAEAAARWNELEARFSQILASLRSSWLALDLTRVWPAGRQ